MITKGFILVEGQNIKDLVRSYNRDRNRIDCLARKIGTDRIKAIRQRRIKNDGFDIIYGTLKSEKGNWDYNLIVKVIPKSFKYFVYSFTIIDDPIRPKKREIILWECTIQDSKNETTRCPIIIKQHALERYYQRHLKEEFTTIKEAARYFISNELILETVKDMAVSPGVVQKNNVSLAVKSGQLLAYTRENGVYNKTKPTIFNTFVSNIEIEKEQRENQIINENIKNSICKEI